MITFISEAVMKNKALKESLSRKLQFVRNKIASWRNKQASKIKSRQIFRQVSLTDTVTGILLNALSAFLLFRQKLDREILRLKNCMGCFGPRLYQDING